MSLRQDAEKAATALWAELERTYGYRCPPSPEFVADTIEAEAKRFAERALRAHDDELRCKCDDCKARISKAIEAAERDES
jgi:3-methyladenine DNA glycosylase/8-oxoguanine DNA glycosylase